MKSSVAERPARAEARLETAPLPQRKGDGVWFLLVALGTLAIAAFVLYYRIPAIR